MSDLKLDHILRCHPIIKTDIVRAENANLFTNDGKKIIDFEAGVWCTALGHSNKRVIHVMINQINKVMNLHYKLTNESAEILAVTLLKQFHFQDGKAVFLNSGSEAVEFSIRISKLISKSNKILTFTSSYLSAYSNTSIPRDKSLWIEIDYLKCNGCTNKECTNKCSMLKNINFEEVGAFILESATCGRILFPPYKLVKFLTNEVKEHNGLIIANEVTTGFGRSGEWFGYNHYDVEPDIVSLGKALGNGYPISAVVMSKEVADSVESKNFAYVQSHQNDPIGCVIANEVIDIINSDNMIQASKEKGDFFFQQLKEIKDDCAIIKEVRGRGLMLALELKINNVTEVIAEKMLEKGYFIGIVPLYNILRFFPALTISKDDILSMCQILKYELKELETKYIEYLM